jgi:hypothetical protein
MHPFTYKYRELTHKSSVNHYIEQGYHRYKITYDDGYFVLVKSGIPGTNSKIIWVQSNKPGEIILPHDVVQSIGEGIEEFEVKMAFDLNKIHL